MRFWPRMPVAANWTKFGSLVATVARLEVEEDWLGLVRAAAADGW